MRETILEISEILEIYTGAKTSQWKSFTEVSAIYVLHLRHRKLIDVLLIFSFPLF